MCGIVGFTGSQNAAPILLDGLKKLYQAQADRRFIPQSQLWQGEDRPEDRRGDSAFLI